MTTYFPALFSDCTTCALIDENNVLSTASFQNGRADFHNASVTLEETADGIGVSLAAPETPISWVILRFPGAFPSGTLFYGDEWERGYGALQWSTIRPERRLPWYFAAYNANTRTFCGYGVKVRPHAMCVWQVDGEGISLYLDVRSGPNGVRLGARTLRMAEVVYKETADTEAYSAMTDFCRTLCPDPLLPAKPVYGFNNWYYAYGNSSREGILADVRLLADVTSGLENRPYMVIDDGWQINSDEGSWVDGKPNYGDMGQLAADMAAGGVIPGIWVRLLTDTCKTLPEDWRRGPSLDPSVPGVLEHVKTQIRRFYDWGFRLIKHDFSSIDMCGFWGKDMKFFATGMPFADQTVTTAEVVLHLYEAIREAAQDAIVIGCNTFPHLLAGLAELNRTGDDTSGVDWNRTRRMGVNTLAFRMPQNRTFYMSDADCVGIRPNSAEPWALNKEWLRLLARSGSPLFVSCDPKAATPEVRAALTEAFRINAAQTDEAEPLDWLDNTCPANWKINGQTEHFHWYDELGYNAALDPEK